MIQLAKRVLQWMLSRLGYVVLRRETYLSLMKPIPPRPTAIETRQQEKDEATSKSTEDVDGDFKRLIDKINPNLAKTREAPTAYSIATDITVRNVIGDIVDCGDGAPSFLGLLAAALVLRGDSSRHLTLLDVSGDPSNKSDDRLLLWGGNGDLLAEARRRSPQVDHEAPLPPELRLSTYPPSRITLLRHESDYRADRPIALLRLSAEAYPANRAAAKRLVPLVARGGLILIDMRRTRLQDGDFIDQTFSQAGLKCSVKTMTDGLKLVQRTD